MDWDCRIRVGRVVLNGNVETTPDRQRAINGQLFEQSGAGAFSGQHGMSSGIAIWESVAETPTAAEDIAVDCAAAGRASGVTTSPTTATAHKILDKAIQIFTEEEYHRPACGERCWEASSRQRELTLQAIHGSGLHPRTCIHVIV
jgi:hypothetical protein